MKASDSIKVEKAKAAALAVLRHNAKGPYHGLPRTAGWGYPEPYTRDLLLSLFGIAVTGDKPLLESAKRVLLELAKNQTQHGHISSLVHDPEDRGSSDSTPLFLIGVGIYRKASGDRDFLQSSAEKAITWMKYQSPADDELVAQLPTSDWRDEQWVLGYGLFVNTLAYTFLRIHGLDTQAEATRNAMSKFTITCGEMHRHVHEGLVVKHKPYYALWSYKIFSSERFDLLGNSLAILSGIASPSRANDMVSWIEAECSSMREAGLLSGELPPNFFPYINRTDIDWRPRYEHYNKPGDYHNGGIWPFICGFYVAALVAAKRHSLAKEKLLALTDLVTLSSDTGLEFGFNEWIQAPSGKTMGQDWQTWSAALYLYAAKCVETQSTPYFDEMR